MPNTVPTLFPTTRKQTTSARQSAVAGDPAPSEPFAKHLRKKSERKNPLDTKDASPAKKSATRAEKRKADNVAMRTDKKIDLDVSIDPSSAEDAPVDSTGASAETPRPDAAPVADERSDASGESESPVDAVDAESVAPDASVTMIDAANGVAVVAVPAQVAAQENTIDPAAQSADAADVEPMNVAPSNAQPVAVDLATASVAADVASRIAPQSKSPASSDQAASGESSSSRPTQSESLGNQAARPTLGTTNADTDADAREGDPGDTASRREGSPFDLSQFDPVELVEPQFYDAADDGAATKLKPAESFGIAPSQAASEIALSVPQGGGVHDATRTGAAPPAPTIAPELHFAEANHPKVVTDIRSQLLPNGGTMEIRLDPPELGVLQVRVEMRDGVMTASFQTSNDDATKLLSHSLAQLKSALESQGVSVEKLHVQQSPRDNESNNSNDPRQQHQAEADGQSARQEQQRREMLRRMWRRVSGAGDPLDLVA